MKCKFCGKNKAEVRVDEIVDYEDPLPKGEAYMFCGACGCSGPRFYYSSFGDGGESAARLKAEKSFTAQNS